MGWEPDWIKEIEDAATRRPGSDASRQYGPGEDQASESVRDCGGVVGIASPGLDPLRGLEAVGQAPSENVDARDQISTRLGQALPSQEPHTPQPGTIEFTHPRSFRDAFAAGCEWTDWSLVVPGIVPPGKTTPDQGLPAIERLIASGPLTIPWEELNESGRKHNSGAYNPRPSATKSPSKKKPARKRKEW